MQMKKPDLWEEKTKNQEKGVMERGLFIRKKHDTNKKIGRVNGAKKRTTKP